MVTLEEILVAAGATVTNDAETEVDIDLSFGNVDKTTFVNILS